MIYQVRVLAPSGKVKQVISRKQLSHSHWEKFENRGNPFMLNKTKQINAWIKERHDLEIVSLPLETGTHQTNLETRL
jgi:hypothetical protein